MKQYINKAAVVAEIEKRIKALNEILSRRPISWPTLEKLIEENKKVLSFLNTLEAKEVDLEKEIEEVKHNYKVDDNRHTSICSADIEWLAKHFFELGVKTQKGE